MAQQISLFVAADRGLIVLWQNQQFYLRRDGQRGMSTITERPQNDTVFPNILGHSCAILSSGG
jgi:hypothetical protein